MVYTGIIKTKWLLCQGAEAIYLFAVLYKKLHFVLLNF